MDLEFISSHILFDLQNLLFLRSRMMFYSDCTSCKIVQFVDKSSINYISPLFILVTELKTICKRFFCLN